MMIYLKRRVSSFGDSLKSLYPSIPVRNATNQTHHFWCAQKPRQLRSHSTRRKMMMIYLKRGVSSFGDSLKSLYPSIPVRNATNQTHHFWCAQKPRELRSHSTRRKMMMIYFKRRVSSFADSLKSLYAMSSRGLQNEINGFLNCLEKVFSSCRIHLRTAMVDRDLQDLIPWVSTKLGTDRNKGTLRCPRKYRLTCPLTVSCVWVLSFFMGTKS